MNFFNSISVEYENLDDYCALSDWLTKNKVVVVSPTNFPENDLPGFYLQLASHLGTVYLAEETADTEAFLLNKWHQIRYIPGQEAKSYKHSNRAQPLHTDFCALPIKPEISFFYCMQQATFGGSTVFMDNNRLVEILRVFNPNLLRQILTTEVTFRTDIGQNVTSRLIEQDQHVYRINWNYYRLVNEDETVKAITEDFHFFLEEHIFKSGMLKAVNLKAGEAVFFHDNLVLHGRNSFLGDRWLNKGVLQLNKES
jgi:alpha-ketoglutarate-dependent taurine dioxygenase